MSAPRDTLVIGAGHNGLTAAALLARRGRKVLVLEARDVIGGMAASDEFHSGYRSAGLLHDTGGVRRSVIEALDLRRHGLSMRTAPAGVLALDGAGKALFIDGDPSRAERNIRQLSPTDADSYVRFRAYIESIRGVLRSFLDEAPVDLIDVESAGAWDLFRRALKIRRLGRHEMMEILRLPPMAVADWLDEWFETDLLKAALAMPAVAGNYLGPRSPGSNTTFLFHQATAGSGVVGGGPALVAALEKAARGHGAEIRTGARVARILVDSGRACGVVLDGGEEIRASTIATSCDPRQVLLDMLPAGTLAYRTEHKLRHFRSRGTTAQVLLALETPLKFAAAPDDPVEFARTGGCLDDLEKAFDAVKYRRFSERPVLDIHVPTVSQPDLAPPGHAVVSILVHFASHELEPAWDDDQRTQLGERVLDVVERHAPGVRGSIVSGVVLTPVDIEARYGVTGGHIYHGEHCLDQILVRPVPECSRYATPVPGLFLCGSGSHPGGGLTCAPGSLAAAAILS